MALLNPKSTLLHLSDSRMVVGKPYANELLELDAIADLEPLRLDRKWLDKASALLIKHWKIKNERKNPENPK